MGDPELGRRIREARNAAGLSQKQLADAVGLAHPQSISNAERGISEVPHDRLKRIATVTSKPLTFFLDPATSIADLPSAPKDIRAMVREELEAFLADSLEPLLQRLLDRAPPGPRSAGSVER